MTAPVPEPRGTPSGVQMGDGYQTLITFSTPPVAPTPALNFDPTKLSFWEKSVTPVGYDGGDIVDNTTMHNIEYRTGSPRFLKTLTEAGMTAAYDPAVAGQLIQMINLETTVTINFPDGSTLAFWGFLRTFVPGELVEGTQPEATIAFNATNRDPVTKSEEAPVYTAPA